MAYQPFTYSSPNIPTINPLAVVGTDLTVHDYNEGSSLLKSLSDKALSKVRKNKQNSVQKEEPKEELKEEEQKEEQSEILSENTDDDSKGKNIKAENETIITEQGEGDLD